MRKKNIAIFMALSMQITGCQGIHNEQTVTNSPVVSDIVEVKVTEKTEPIEVTEKTAEEAEKPRITIITESKTYQNEEKTLDVLYYERQYAVLEKDNNYKELAGGVARFFADNKTAMEAKAEDYAKESGRFLNEVSQDEAYQYIYSLNQQVIPERADSRILSLELITYEYRGGAHGGNIYSGVTFDAKTGKELNFSDVITDQEKFKSATYDYIVNAVETYAGEDGLYPEYKETIQSSFDNLTWTLTDYGMQITYPEYELAPFAAGAFTVDLPYSLIKDYMNQEYLPVEGKDMFVKLTKNQCYQLDFGKGEQQALIKEDIDTGENYYLKSAVMTLGEKEMNIYQTEEYGLYYSGEYYYVKNKDNKEYLLATFLSDNDWKTTFVYELQYGELEKVDQIDGSIVDANRNVEGFEMSHKVDIFGTYEGKKTYTISANGKIVTNDTEYRLTNEIGGEWERVLTAKSQVKAVVDGKEMTLEPESKISPVAVGDGKLYFKMDGKDGCLEYEDGDYGMQEIGGIDVEEIFDGIEYAG